MFGEFTPVAEKLVAKSTAPLLAKIAELEQRTGDVNQRAAKTDEDRFVDRVRASVPTFDDLVNDPDWPEFGKQKVPLTSMTIFGALEDAHNARDIERVTGILNSFAAHRSANGATSGHANHGNAPAHGTPPNGSTPAASNGLSQFATPPSASNNPSNKATPKYRASDYGARLADLRAKRISTTDFEAFDSDFQAAKRAGLVT
jgi:hypothetical protein